MNFIVKHFNELSTTELYEILKTRFEIFVTEQECIYHDEAAGVAQIGRVVTLEHGKGIGGQMLHEGVKVAVLRKL